MNHNRATSTTLGDEEPYIYKKGPAFGMPGVLVDGMDVLKVCGVCVCVCVCVRTRACVGVFVPGKRGMGEVAPLFCTCNLPPPL